MTTTVTFRTDDNLKKDATVLFDSLGMSLSTAINLFLKQAVIKQQYPCSLELEITKNQRATYPDNFFSLFGSGNDLGMDEEPEELSFEFDHRELML